MVKYEDVRAVWGRGFLMNRFSKAIVCLLLVCGLVLLVGGVAMIISEEYPVDYWLVVIIFGVCAPAVSIWMFIIDARLRKKIHAILQDEVVEKTAIVHDVSNLRFPSGSSCTLEIRRHGKMIVREGRIACFTKGFYNNATVRVAYSPKYDEILLLKD